MRERWGRRKEWRLRSYAELPGRSYLVRSFWRKLRRVGRECKRTSVGVLVVIVNGASLALDKVLVRDLGELDHVASEAVDIASRVLGWKAVGGWSRLGDFREVGVDEGPVVRVPVVEEEVNRRQMLSWQDWVRGDIKTSSDHDGCFFFCQAESCECRKGLRSLRGVYAILSRSH